MEQIEGLLRRSVVLLDKPSGPTSREIDERVKAILKRKKAGHAGTLDSKVTGLLVIALDEATKAMPFLANSDKTYEGIIQLHGDVDFSELERFIGENFTGLITQTPPVKSRVARRPRERAIYYFNLLGKEGKNVHFRTKVQGGTYIRKLVHDIGEKFNVSMHMKSLRRTESGHFSIGQAVTLEQLEEAYREYEGGDSSSLEKILMPLEEVLKDERRVKIKKDYIPKVLNGSPIRWEYIESIDREVESGDNIVLLFEDKIIGIGVALVDFNAMRSSSRPVVKTDRLILD
ncbi:hypothetical protein A3K63_05520 [Candidatus Micrarchaeota archaeon RBG_16_49_10]|nr:MAG: hypothetical protein A3K63_05520 [Candidatus Micrarchaeota archaeon RBG_16_49_10]